MELYILAASHSSYHTGYIDAWEYTVNIPVNDRYFEYG